MSSISSSSKTLPVVAAIVSVLLLVTISFRLLLPYSYLTLLCIYAIVISLIIVLSARSSYTSRSITIIVMNVIVFALLLRSLYMLRTNFSVEPLYDGYKDIVVSYLFFRHKHAYIVNEPYSLAYASSFPALNILNVIMAEMLSTEVLKSAIFLSLTTGFYIYLTIVLFAKYFMKRVQLTYHFIALVLVLSSVWPELIYYSIVYYPRHFCLALYCLLMYLILTSKYLPIAIILAIALPLSYGYYPALTTIALTIFLISRMLFVIAAKLKRTSTLGSMYLVSFEPRIRFVAIIIVVLLISELAVLMYHAAQSVLESCKSILNKMLLFWSHKPPAERQLHAPYWIPPVLHNPLNILVKLRDLIIYVSAFIGFLILLSSVIRGIFKKDFSAQFAFKLNLLLVAMAYTITWIISADVIQTLISLIIYFLIPLSALAYYYLLDKAEVTRYRIAIAMLFTMLLTISIVAGGLSLWSHRVILRHYYDYSISLVEAGDHNPLYIYVKDFIDEYLLLNKTYKVLSDDPVIAEYIFYIKNPGAIVGSCYGNISEIKTSVNTIVIMFLGRNILLGPYGWHDTNISLVYLKKLRLISLVNNYTDLIYKLNSIHINIAR